MRIPLRLKRYFLFVVIEFVIINRFRAKITSFHDWWSRGNTTSRNKAQFTSSSTPLLAIPSPAKFVMSLSNNEARSSWELFQHHRGIVTNLLLEEAVNPPCSLCVLGAGHCNDINLAKLLEKYEKITLADIDLASLQHGIQQQLPSGHERIEFAHADLSNQYQLLEQIEASPKGPSTVQLAQLKASSTFTQIPELGKYDVVASTCLLSQILKKIVMTLDDRDDTFVEILKAARHSHLEVMLNALKPGGVGILVTDFVSSDSLPDLAMTQDLNSTVIQAISTNNFFHGLNPHMVAKVLQESELKSKIQTLDLTDPWKWQTQLRVYACFGLIFQKVR